MSRVISTTVTFDRTVGQFYTYCARCGTRGGLATTPEAAETEFSECDCIDLGVPANGWLEPDYERELDGKDESIPCPFCGADRDEPCADTCDTLAPLDAPGTIDWFNVAATSRSHSWEGLNDEA